MSDSVIITSLIVYGAIQIVTLLKVEKVHKATNSMKDALIVAEKLVSHGEGMEAQKVIDSNKTTNALTKLDQDT